MSLGQIRDSVVGFFYRKLLKPIFFLQDPEKVHDRMVTVGRFLAFSPLTRGLSGLLFGYQHPELEQEITGLRFKNPIGLAAGFDKEAFLPGILPSVGFAFEEAGSITAQPFEGNERPWMWRLPEHQALRINYGLKNSGAVNIHKRLAGQKFGLILGISIAKTNSERTSHLAAGIEDYLASYRMFQDVGDYFTINISCPNTCEAKPIFAEPENLDQLLQKMFILPKHKPVFIKLSPDLPEPQLLGILKLGQKYPVDGFVCTNLTKINSFGHQGKGGFSGKAVAPLADAMIAKVYRFYGGKKIIIGCGGVFSAQDAYKKIRLGASLIQLITGMIFQGPQLVGEINRGLAVLLRRDGFNHIGQAIGADSRV
ncbi:MAG: quinone-dependent dihydroorotate dehydrogenase [Patescibacteria group bacterium]|nr:quinone-dependent dihydroorotate dehydrogenase [Patescibacteria group bacterium]